MKEKMTREMAARILHPDTSLEAQEEVGATMDDVNEACRMGAEALQPWVRTADRRPTPKDADVAGFVLGGYWVDGEPEVSSYRWFWIAENPQSPPPFWMPIPPLPDHLADAGKKVADHA